MASKRETNIGGDAPMAANASGELLGDVVDNGKKAVLDEVKLTAKIDSVISAIKSLSLSVTTAMRVMELEPEYQGQVIQVLEEHNIDYIE